MTHTVRMVYRTLEEVPLTLIAAYDLGQYTFTVPPVSTRGWDKLDWINWVHFAPDLETLRNNKTIA